MDRSRTEPLYNPRDYPEQSVGLIGAGAVGSKVALDLACLGVTNVTVYDDDVIEPHNLSNQAYQSKQIGYAKVGSLESLVGSKVGTENFLKWQFNNRQFSKLYQHTHKILISALDTRYGREDVMWNAMANQSELVVDCRMDAYQGSVMMYDPRKGTHRDNYQANLPSEDYEGETTACGLPINCGVTSGFVSATATTLLINWWKTGIMENIHFNLSAMELWRTPVEA